MKFSECVHEATFQLSGLRKMRGGKAVLT